AYSRDKGVHVHLPRAGNKRFDQQFANAFTTLRCLHVNRNLDRIPITGPRPEMAKTAETNNIAIIFSYKYREIIFHPFFVPLPARRKRMRFFAVNSRGGKDGVIVNI